jgi:hypothetical protein
MMCPVRVATIMATTTTTMTADDYQALPSSAFESLLPKLLAILQVTQRPEGTENARNKQDLLQAVSPSPSPLCSFFYT